MISLFPFQTVAAHQIADRFASYWRDPPWRGTTKHPRKVPFYQALEAIPGSGKTAILADTVERCRAVLPLDPFVVWLSKGRVVVSQTYANLQEGGKYHHLIDSFEVHYLSEYIPEYALDINASHLFFATVGTFNQKDKERGDRLIFKSDIDTMESSIWEALKRREDAQGRRRPLMIVYDEAQNLTDQQANLLMELEPDAVLLASATLRAALGIVVADLKSAGWTDETLVTRVDPKAVAQSGLIKNELHIGGYQAPMEPTIDDMLVSFKEATDACIAEGLSFQPKAIYVCKTNIVEGNSFQRDDPKQPFAQRQAPPIAIWRYLVEQKGIAPETIAVYCNLDFDKQYSPPESFVVFKGGDDDYETFTSGDFRHVIFNLSLQEGWDDPTCYFAYIDKSMGSTVQVEQLVGRVLRQPAARIYDADVLNTAHFYVRVDARNIFSDVVKAVRGKIQSDAPTIKVTAYGAGSGVCPVAFPTKEDRLVPKVRVDSSEVLNPVADLVAALPDFRLDAGANVRGEGSRAVIQQRLGDAAEPELTWVAIDHNNTVTARWVFQRAVQRLYPKALDLAASDDPKFDAKVEVGSIAFRALETLAENVVAAYFQYARLAQRPHNPYRIKEIVVDASKVVRFKNAIHTGYAGLNPLERGFADEVDKTGYTWCRNPSRTGFGIPLLSIGRTSEFFPDFLIWKDNDVFAIDTTGEHLLREKTWRKLLAVEPAPKTKSRLHVRLVSPGRWNDDVEQTSKSGYTVWRLRNDQKIGMDYVEDIAGAVKACVSTKGARKRGAV